MDLRVEKTRRAVYNAFLELRAKKPLEKISVQELCALAQINKSTFYAHYEDIYALSDRLEDQVVESVMENLPCPERIFEDPAGFTRDLFWAYTAQENLIDILFSVRYAELVFGKPEILSGLQTCNHTFWQFLPKKLSTKYRRREPGKMEGITPITGFL